MLARRHFMSLTALATAAGLSPQLYAQAEASEPRLTTVINGTSVPRSRVLQWEARRLQVASDRIRRNLPGAISKELDALLLRPALSTTKVARDRQLLADVKLRLGERQMRSLTALDLAVSTPASVLSASANRWIDCRTVVRSDRGTARGFASWFAARRDTNDVRAMLVACPDHYVIDTPGRGRQEVIEVTGGAMVASRFLIDYADTAEVPIAVSPGYGVQAAGCARTDDGRMIGGVRHQFRDNPGGGFTADLGVAFPALLPAWFISEHRWHLACEFGNWITAYVATLS